MVLLDEGSTNTGTVFQSDLAGYRGFTHPIAVPEDPDSPYLPVESYDHVVFVKEMATEVEIDDVSYQAMHRNAVIGVITDD